MALREIVISAAVSTAALMTAVQTKAAEIKPDGWIIPKVSSATHIGNMRKDLIDEIPGRETVVGVYRAGDETYFNTLTANGRLYGFYVDTDGKPPMEYTLFDTDGDGDFEHKSSLENPETPKYLLSSTSE